MSNMYGKVINLLKGYVKIGDKQYEICSAEPSEELGEHIKAIVNDLVVNNIIDVIDTEELTNAIMNNIQGLDSEAKQEATEVNPLSLAIKLTDGKVTEISGYIETNTYDAYGAAKDVQGETDKTVKDAYELADAAQTKDEVSDAIDEAIQ